MTVNQLWAAAWGLGIGAAVCVLFVVSYADQGPRIRAELIVWATIGVMAAIFSACAAVIAAVKSVEDRHLGRAVRERIEQVLRAADPDEWFTAHLLAERAEVDIAVARAHLFRLGHRERVLEVEEVELPSSPEPHVEPATRAYRWSR